MADDAVSAPAFQDKLRRNGLMAAAQSIVATGCLFLAYRILITHEGLRDLGLWSLLMVFGGIATTVDFSGASALARFVARHEKEFGDHVPRSDAIHTVLISSLAINFLLVILIVAAAPLAIPRIVEPDQWQKAWALLPFVAATILTLPLATGISASLDGLGWTDQRAWVGMASSAAGLAVAAIAIPEIGVTGFAAAQLVQQGLIVIGGWWLLRHKVSGLGLFPSRWRRVIFQRTAAYALKLNGIGILGLLFEPLVKLVVNHFGGTAAIGTYELAARLVSQLRLLVVNAAAPLIPVLAVAGHGGHVSLPDAMKRAQRAANCTAPLVLVLSLIGAPIMSMIILKSVSVDVLRFNAWLALGWSINLLSLPAYLAAQAQGILRWNAWSHAAIGATVVAAAVLFAPRWGVEGVVAGVAIALSLGAVVTVAGNAVRFGFMATLRAQWVVVAIVTVTCVAITLIANHTAAATAGLVNATLGLGLS